VIRRLDLRDGDRSAPLPAGVLPRAELDVEAAVETVRPICADVRDRGVEAIRAASARFDGVQQDAVDVPRSVLDRALHELDPDVRAGLEESIARLRRSCEAERGTDDDAEDVPTTPVEPSVPETPVAPTEDVPSQEVPKPEPEAPASAEPAPQAPAPAPTPTPAPAPPPAPTPQPAPGGGGTGGGAAPG